jgi:Fe2+ or Zn2+ uptake regulation protein
MAAADAHRLRAAGLRVTYARLAILDVIRSGNHPGTDEITTAVRDRIGHVTLQGVYEALAALTSAGLIRRIEPAGSPARYGGGRVRRHLQRSQLKPTGAPAVSVLPAVTRPGGY